MAKSSAEPVVLELASLAREQMGPFMILGLDKAADHATIERHWADRVKWARRQIIKVALEDINWARDVLNDTDRRVKADASSLNADTNDRTLTALAERFGLEAGQATRLWQPLDSEKDLADYSPAAEIPETDEVRQRIQLPEVPEEMPAAAALLAGLTMAAIDPWAVQLLTPSDGGGVPAPAAAK